MFFFEGGGVVSFCSDFFCNMKKLEIPWNIKSLL
jgi:hypothetical protein